MTVLRAFVLTGGGSLGAVQAGMLAALHEHGIEPDLLVGTSAGALNAAYVAGPGTTGDRVTGLMELWGQVRRRDVFVTRPRRWLAAAVGSAPSLFTDHALRSLLEAHLGYALLEDARVPVHVVATDVVTGQGLAMADGPVVDAVLASAAVPGLLPPVRRDDRSLFDGGVGDFDAVRHAEALGATEVYLLPAGFACAGPEPRTALGTSLTAVSQVLHRQLLARIREHEGPAVLHVLPPLCPLAVSPADFGQAELLLARSLRATRRWLGGGRPTPDPASVLALHRHVPGAAAGVPSA